MPSKKDEFDVDKWFDEQQQAVLDHLTSAITTAAGFDQMLWSELEQVLSSFIRRLHPEPVQCGRCKEPVSYLEYVMNQGTCGPCVSAICMENDEWEERQRKRRSEDSNTPKELE